jgi:hypothetical protein
MVEEIQGARRFSWSFLGFQKLNQVVNRIIPACSAAGLCVAKKEVSSIQQLAAWPKMRVPPMLQSVKTKVRARFSLCIRRRHPRFLSLSFSYGLEVLALRQRVCVLKRKRSRSRLNCWDRLFWLALRRFWSGWKGVLGHRETRHRGRLAPGRFSVLPALAISAAARQTEN